MSRLSMDDLVSRTARAIPWLTALSPLAMRTWLVLLALSPLAILVGLWLQESRGSPYGLPVRLAVSREEAIRRARAEAQHLGVDASAWGAALKVNTDEPWANYIVAERGSQWRVLEALAPVVTLDTTLRGPRRGQSFRAWLSAEDGRVVSYTYSPGVDPGAPASLDTPEARQLARSALAARLAPRFALPTTSPETETNRGVVLYRWKLAPPNRSDLELVAESDVRSGRVTGERLRVEVDAAAQKRTARDRWLKLAGVVALPLFFTGMFLFVLVRYLQRWLQGEVSHARTLLVVALVGLFFIVFSFLTDQFVRQSAEGAEAMMMVVIISVTMALMGLAAGIAYSGSEGDLREHYPGKLTALDALLLGRWFTRNVGLSLVTGLAGAGWLTLVVQCLLWLDSRPPLAIAQLEGLAGFLYSRAPMLSFIMSPPSLAILVGLFALLLPLTVVRRITRRPWVSLVLLVVLGCVGLLFLDREGTGATLVAVALLKVGLMLLVFFRADLLAAITVLAGHHLFRYVGISQLAPFWAPEEVLVALSLLASAAFAVAAALRGRLLQDHEVAPPYARNLIERLSLRDEVSATQEAQRRLLPVSPPAIEGLSIAAAFQAAELVGGDFYDFFALGPTRLGVVVMDGGGRGLATALSIALTKGFLMQKAQAGHSPGETVRSLQATLGEFIHGEERSPGLCYAVLDTADGSLHYARVGDSPRLLFAPAMRDERDVVVQERVTHAHGQTLATATLQLHPGLRILLYTDGLAQRAGRHGAEHWLRERIAEHGGGSTESLHGGLWRALHQVRWGRRSAPLKDDITLVVLGVERLANRSMEQVA